MSAKRQAQYEIDEKTLQDKPANPSAENKNQKDKDQNQPGQRKIVSVKKDESQNNNNDANKKQPAKPLFGGLFSNAPSTSLTNGTGLFSNGNKTTSNLTGGLFSSGSSNPVGLFSNNSSGLFGNNSSGLFANKNQSSKPSGGLFNGSQTIFNFQSSGVPPVKNTPASLFGSNDQEDGSGDSAQLQVAQNIQADPSKSTAKYQYEQACKVLINQKAFKFKKQGGDLIENVEVVVKQDNGSQMYLISVLLPATKKSIFNGIILPKKSQVKHLNNKKQNVEVSTFLVQKQKLEQYLLKFQFQKQNQGVQLHKVLSEIINETIKLPQSPKQQKEPASQKTQKQQKTENKPSQNNKDSKDNKV